MVTAVINLDFVPLFFFFVLYSALEIFISRTMEDYRYRLIEIEAEFEQDPEDEQDDPDAESDVFNNPELEDDDDDSSFDEEDYQDEEDDDEEDYEEEEEEEELLFPVVRLLHRDAITEDDDDDYDYEDNEDYDEDYYEEDYEEEELEELFPVVRTSSMVSSEVVFNGGMVTDNNGVREDSDGSESCEGKNGGKCGGEIHGSVCPICFEAWTSGGEHQICCLPCGHIYGLSCIKKWLHQSRSSGKCPQCNTICTFKDVRVLYASRLCVADEELQKRVRSLEAKCAYLEQKAGPLTPDELIDQICSNPAAVQRLATVLAGLYQQPAVSP